VKGTKMGVKRSELMTNNLKICENCEWCCYHERENEFPMCMLNGEQKGLVEQCHKFKEKTGNHFTIYY